jgi:hypothetical protein
MSNEKRLPGFVTVRAHTPLRRSLALSDATHLEVSVVILTANGRIAGVDTSEPRAGYTDLLRSLLVGRTLDELDDAMDLLAAHFGGRLLLATAMALRTVAAKGRALAENGWRPAFP